MSRIYFQNPVLYGQMIRAFADREVRVVYPGIPATVEYAPDAVRGRHRLRIHDWGESYVTDCPFCSDTRGRLYVNHLYGVVDVRLKETLDYVWRCFNTDCQRFSANRRALLRRLSSRPTALPPHARPPVPIVGPASTRPSTFPGESRNLTELPEDHPACQYLRSRRFDPQEIGSVWQVSVAGRAPPGMSWVSGRLVIPVVNDGIVVGWQARRVYELTKAEEKARRDPKYLTYFSKSRYLYGEHLAQTSRLIGVFEGVTSVWRFGPGGVAVLGKGLSSHQVDRLVRLARGRPILLYPDGDDPQSLQRFAEDAATLIAHPGLAGPVGLVPPVPGGDPADQTREQLWESADQVIAEAAIYPEAAVPHSNPGGFHGP